MRLLRVSVRRKQWNALFFEPDTPFEGEYAKDGGLLIDRTAFDESDLQEGCDCTEEQIEALIRDSRRRRAYSKGMWLLSARDYTEKGLTDKLRRDFGEDAAARAVARLCELGFVDDERYAYHYAERMMADGNRSARQAQSKLMVKGVPRELAEAAVASVAVSDADQLDHWIANKYAVKLAHGDPDQVRKVVNALMRRGFAYSEIRKALNRYAAELPDEEEENDYAL